MKRTTFLLTSLTAIILLSCSSFDNSNSSAEDVSYLPVQALQKVSPVDNDITPYGSGSMSVSINGTMSVSAVPLNQCTWSNEILSSNLISIPSGTTIISNELSCGTTSGGGTGNIGNFSIYSIKIRYGNNSTDFSWNGNQPITFTGTQNNAFFISFYGCCIGAGSSGTCSRSIGNCRMTTYYQY